MPDLTDVLTRITQGVARNAFPHEMAVRTKIMQPILQELGWDVIDPDKVCDEFPLKLESTTRRIDLALCVSNRHPLCIIELKSTDYDLKEVGRSAADRQLFEYAWHAGAPLALLTNGVIWRFYSTVRPGTRQDRLVRALDLKSQPLEEVAAALDRYLSYANTESGKAADYALDDLRERLDRDKARAEIPHAWSQLAGEEPHEQLVDLLTEVTAGRTKQPPAKADVVAFLRRLSPDGKPLPPPPPSPLPPPPPPPPGGVHYYLLGEERAAKNATQAYIAIFDDLARRDAGFLGRVEPELSGRKNKLVARTKQGLSARASITRRAVPLSGNWFLHTNLTNKQKLHALRIACTVAGIPFGKRSGLAIDLLTPPPPPPPPPPQGVHYYLRGEERVAKNAVLAFVAIFDDLARQDGGFLGRVEPELHGRKNRGVARTKQALSANELMTRNAAQLPGNWFLLTHLSNKQKIKNLRIACKVAGIPFGSRAGLKIDLPNA